MDPTTVALAPETLARWQFGITTVYHFLFVPLTISLAALTAGLETAWVRTGKEKYFHATKFWGKLFLINIAIGVATGLVQEFQFGMNWSDYSKFVGDVFGAPLAMEALIAFFFESTFIGLWIFGWDKLPKKLHCACMWMVSIGTLASAYFILAANSWMQHPVGYEIDKQTGVARLNDIGHVLFQNTAIVQFAHTVSSAFLTGGAFMIGIASFLLWKIKKQKEAGEQVDRKRTITLRSSLRIGLVTTMIAGVLVALSGDQLAKVMFKQQPMKMAAAEALWDTECPAPFSVFAVGDVTQGRNSVEIELPGLLSFLADSNFSSCVPGIHETAKAEAEKYGGQPEDYVPNIFVTFWGFRLMIGIGLTAAVAAGAGFWLTRKRRWLLPEHRRGEDEIPKLMLTNKKELGPTVTKWGWRVGMASLIFPFIANSIGWIFTEMGRQPWAVFGLFKTADSVSPGVSQTEMAISLTALTLLYAVLFWINVRLMKKYAVKGPDTDEEPPTKDPKLRGPSGDDSDDDDDADKPLTFAY
ncbi:cytochrome ubiquinol oxidase subunit I [Streptomyces sp. NPDC051684]|uniref:cytochrome ubiquinol oxidase subunit I n=1 Tax=Streptomyces sp. NPDC051684 TaxID=3365670 RepID=UPI0037A20BB1